MVALLCHLRTTGLLVVLDTQRKPGTLHYLHASFDRPEVEGQTIRLNERGDYTNHPESILDKRQQVLFKGNVLEGETYELVARSFTGTVCVSEALHALIASWDVPGRETLQPAATEVEPLPRRSPRRTWRAVLFATTTLALGSTLSYLCAHARSSDVALAAVAASMQASVREQAELRQTVAQRPAAAAPTAADTAAKPAESAEAPGSQLEPEQRDTHKPPSLPLHVVPTSSANAKPPSLLTPFYGIDISHWNGDFAREIDQIPALAFAISKATEGTRLRDSQFARNRELLRKRKIAHGSYHFFLQSEDAAAQADFFLATIGAVAPDDIAPVLDVEDESLPRGVETEVMHVQVSVLLLLRTLATKTGRHPILYTNYAFAQRYFRNPAFADYRLWLAEYSSAPPRVPDTWRAAGFFIWQKTGSHRVGSSEVDLDVFFGSKQQLLK
jgi:lysozyme